MRYADDFVVGFQYKQDAENFLEAVKSRFRSFELDLNSDNAKLIEFARFAIDRRQKRGQGRPETLDFLGFTHYCTRSRDGRFLLGRKPIAKRMTRTQRRLKEELRRRTHDSVETTAKWLGKVLDGWLQYFAVPTSHRFLDRFVTCLKRLWLRILRRRSQRDRFDWTRLATLTAEHWPRLEIRHPWPVQRFAVSDMASATQGRSRMP